MEKNSFVYPIQIEIGGLSKEELIKKILENVNKDSDHYDALYIADRALDAIRHKDFVVSPEKKMVKLVYRTVADMGFTEERTKLSDIRDFIKKNYKNEFCDDETALWLRLMWDRITFDWVYITTKFNSFDIADLPSDNPYLFHFCGSYLYNEELNPYFVCGLDTVFVFKSLE
ncbi:MAG: hypothetical protein LiPW41_537 [Parcubacteria group bacterium LiPW_41]|nr:MAG: hypothetical protein LiPW41_537 [Parcubacteria group bacterium LiPW_41]